MIGIDEIISEVRRSRQMMSEQSGHDVRRYVEYLKQFNTKYADQVAKYHQMRPRPAPAQSTPKTNRD